MEPAITNMTAAVFTIKKNKTKINEDRKEIRLSTINTCDCPVRIVGINIEGVFIQSISKYIWPPLSF